MLNWIVWIKTVYLYKNGFGIKEPTNADQNKQTNKQTSPIIIINFENYFA